MGRDLFVGNLDHRVTRVELEKLFAPLGSLQRVNIVTDRETGIPRGFGFVTFGNDAAAEQAVMQFNGFELFGKAIAVSHARSKQDMSTRHSGRSENRSDLAPCMDELFVKGLDLSTDHDELCEIFSAYGQVVKAKVITDRDTGISKGFGFVQMSSQAENDQAIAALNGKSLNGRMLTVNVAREREPRFDRFNNRRGY